MKRKHVRKCTGQRDYAWGVCKETCMISAKIDKNKLPQLHEGCTVASVVIVRAVDTDEIYWDRKENGI